MTPHQPSAGAPSGAPAEESGALARLCSASRETFARDLWGQRAWLSRSTDLPGEVADVFSEEAADELLSRRGLRTPFLRLAKNGSVIAPGRFTGSGGVGAQISDQIIDDAVLRHFVDGTTLVLQGLHRTWSPVRELAADLTSQLGHPVQVNAYITPPQSQGFASHYDTHDVFVLQISGRKRWTVHEPVLREPMANEPWDSLRDQVAERARTEPLLEEVLDPGDCLYLPRGFLHSATALGGTSVHLTFGVHTVVERDIVRGVLSVLEADGWRGSLPVGWDPTGPDGVAQIRSVVKEITAALQTLDVESVADTLHDRLQTQQRPEPVSPLAQARAAGDLSASDRVRLRANLNPRRRVQAGEPCELVLPGGRHVPISDEELPALELLLAGGPVVVGALPVATDAAVGLVRRLLREGVLVTA